MNKNEGTKTPTMSGGYESSSSSEDSFTPVEDLRVCPFDLEPMTSSDGEEVEEHVDPFFHYITVKNISSLSRSKMSRFNPSMEENKLYRYFKALAIKEDDLKMFPKAMRNFLSREHPKIYESLSKLDNGEFFIYLGKSLVVTLNIENSRVRVPTSLIFDACVFSVNQPVVVISVFQQNTNVSRMNMYNTFLARGVTEALRSYSCEKVSVKKGAITDERNVHEAVHKLQQESTEFENTSFFTMSKSKAENLVEALLRSTAVASTYLVINPKEDPDVVWFLNIEEFEFLTGFIDMISLPFLHTIVGDKNLISLEMLTRLGKRHRTILSLSSIDAKLTRDHFEGHKNITVCEAPDEVYCKNSIIITDHPLEAIKLPEGIRKPNIILVSNSKPGAKDLRDCYKEPEKRLESRLGKLSLTTKLTTSSHGTRSDSDESDINEDDTSKKLSDKSSHTPQSSSFMEETSPMLPRKSRLGKLSLTTKLTTSSHLTTSDKMHLHVKDLFTSHQVDDDLSDSSDHSHFESSEKDLRSTVCTVSRGSSDLRSALSNVSLSSSGYGGSSNLDEGLQLDFDRTILCPFEMQKDYKLSTLSIGSHGSSEFSSSCCDVDPKPNSVSIMEPEEQK